MTTRLRLAAGCPPSPRSAGSTPPATGATTSHTMDFLAGDDDLTTADLRLHDDGGRSSTSTPSELAAPAPPAVDDGHRRLHRPAAGTRRRWCASSRSRSPGRRRRRYEKAVALQDWFREDGGFTYTLDGDRRQRHRRPRRRSSRTSDGRPDRLLRAVRLGDGRDGPDPRHPGPGRGRLPQPRAGRAEHLRSTARTTCTPGPSCTSPGAGWVRFEPTPADRAETVPDYTHEP